MLGIAIMFALAACSDDKNSNPVNNDEKPLKIAVFSDPHLFDPALGSSGEAFEAYLADDRKLLAQSDAIMQAAVAKVIEEKPDILLVPGDLTKDGEKSSHVRFAGYMDQIIAAGIKVYVMPGNHDVNNPHAFSYSGSTKISVENVSKSEFENIYKNCGYSTALYKESNSSSYVTELNKKTWLIAIDACLSMNNATSPITEGEISTPLLAWVKEKLAEAKSKNITVLAMMHHGMTEHYAGQSLLFSPYVIKNWSTIGPELADLGLKAVFTGHFHSHDITRISGKTSSMFDIETGSLVTYPCPYRVIEYNSDGKMRIVSRRIENINYNLGGVSFQIFAKEYLTRGMDGLLLGMLQSQFGLTKEQAEAYAAQAGPYIVPALIAHYEGDESPDAATLLAITQLSTSSDPLMKQFAFMLNAYWTDLAPADNNVTLDLITGSSSR